MLTFKIKNSYEYLTINNRTCDLIKLHKQVINNQVIYNRFNYNYEGDRLVSYGNKYITYDDYLRPIKYNNKELVWDNNRLIHYGDITFKYDNNGLREYKITSNKLHKYIRDGKRLIKEIVRNYASTIIDGESIDNIEIESNEYIIEYNYDINGKIIGFNLDGDRYYFIKNLFGDILKVVDENYNISVEYQPN